MLQRPVYLKENQPNWADTESVSQCLVPANSVSRKIKMPSLCGICQALSDSVIISPVLQHFHCNLWNQDISLFFSNKPIFPLARLLRLPVTPALQPGALPLGSAGTPRGCRSRAVDNLGRNKCHLLHNKGPSLRWARRGAGLTGPGP